LLIISEIRLTEEIPLNSYMADSLKKIKILELTIRTLCDVRAGTVADGVYLFCQTKDNQSSVLLYAQQIIYCLNILVVCIFHV
jgi:hypothetical protein